MNESNQKKKQAQELATNRLMVIFVYVILLLMGMARLYRYMITGSTFLQGQRLNLILLIASAAAAAVCFVWAAIQHKKGTFRKDRLVTPLFIGICFLLFALSCLILRLDYSNGINVLNVLLPVMAVLYLIYLICERRFFTFCVVCVAGVISAYCSYQGARERLFMAILAAVFALIALACATMAPDKGLRKALFGKNPDRRFAVVSNLIILAAVIAAYLLGGKLALIAAIGLAALLLGTAVYYTVRAL